MPITRVTVQELPYHIPDGLVRAALSDFGEVKSVSFRRALQRFRTGDRIVTIDLRQSLPRHIVIEGYNTTVFYNDQPPFCEICKKDHLTSNCPFKGKCRDCREEGHTAWDCPQRQGCASCGVCDYYRLDCPARSPSEPQPVYESDRSSIASKVDSDSLSENVVN